MKYFHSLLEKCKGGRSWRPRQAELQHPKAPCGRPLALICVIILLSVVSLSAETDKAREIESKLIAPCCWSQPILEHDSEIAQQMRNEVSTMLAAGKSRDQILDFYVAKYGERILVTPRAKGFNALAYVLPWAALPIAACVLIVWLVKLRSPAPSLPAPAPLPDSRYSSVIEKEMKDLDE
jgi:cytochrome c-type biogenesis protein CcmH